jgi:hypothetical protein
VKYQLVDCSRKCTLNPDRLPGGLGELVHRWFEEGANRDAIMARSAELGHKLTSGSIQRHKSNHLRPVKDGVAALPDGGPAARISDLDALQAIIDRGAQRLELSSASVTTEQLIAAINLKHKLTEGSVFESMFDAMMGETDEDMADLEAPEAEASAEERAQAAPDG